MDYISFKGPTTKLVFLPNQSDTLSAYARRTQSTLVDRLSRFDLIQPRLFNSIDTLEELHDLSTSDDINTYKRLVNGNRTITKIAECPSQTSPDYPVGKYLKKNMGLFEKYSINLNRALTKFNYSDRPINLVCMGSSGAITSTFLAQRIPTFNNIIHIKKSGEESHSSLYDDIKSISYDDVNIFIDDFISSGTTLKNCVQKFSDEVRQTSRDIKIHGVCVGGSFHADNSNFEKIEFDFIVCQRYFKKEL